MFGFDEGIKLGSNDDEVLGTVFGDVDGITPGIEDETDLGSLDGYFDESYGSKHERLLLEGPLGSTDGRVIGSV